MSRDIYQQVFLVIIPEPPTKRIAKQIQREVNQKYNLYEVLPELHVTLETVTITRKEEIDLLIWAIDEIARKIIPFPIKINDFACFDPPYKSVYLNVIKTEPLIHLYQQVQSRFKKLGFMVKEYPEGIHFHMTIASKTFADREWSNNEYRQACEELKSLSVESDFVFKSLELWYPDLDPERRILARFPLESNT
ncbi:MAG: 2'-5' RNA ligase family protein [Halanaerobiales bacterium]|nr:2'-5' RNA ligase family protein [Halanaerobiales bacterium]